MRYNFPFLGLTDFVSRKSSSLHRVSKSIAKFPRLWTWSCRNRYWRYAISDFAQASSQALTEMSLDKPMSIQCACIPVALLNRDICACARTGSGKTLAFLLPVLERMTKKPCAASRSVTRALIISPTRELAVQIFKVAEKLVKYCPKIRVQLAAGEFSFFTVIQLSFTSGGLDLHSQEASLRQNPDLVIATPGRLIDHLSNAPSFSLHNIEYLVLDEADKYALWDS